MDRFFVSIMHSIMSNSNGGGGDDDDDDDSDSDDYHDKMNSDESDEN